MKKTFAYLGASLAAIAALSSCNKELSDPSEGLNGGIPFEICASSDDTRTAIDGVSTKWVANDAINLFHSKAGSTTYTINDGEFTITSENLAANKFKGTLASALKAGNYDWYAFYPYSSYNKTPAGSSSDNFAYTTIGGTSQTQAGNNSTAHLCGNTCPLYGVATGVSSDITPSFEMNHLTSIVEVNVTNNSGNDLTVSSVSFTSTEDIVGTYYIDFTQTPVVYKSSGESYVSKTASLSVTDGEAIAAKSSATFYIAIKPFTATTGQTLKVSVNGYEKEIPHAGDVTFTAGKIKKINFNFDKVVVDYVTIPWTENFSGNLGIYSLVNGKSDTKTFNGNLAGGTAPELLVSNTNGSFSAKVKASAGDYVLTFMSNHADYLSISVDATAITLTKVSDTEYSLSIPDGVDFFNVTFTNTTGSNTRLDNIELVSNNRTALGTPEVTASLNNTDASVTNSIDVTWNAIENAGSYVVTATPTTGSAVSETVTAVESTTTYKHTFSGLAYDTAYTISVVAKPSDSALYLESAAGEAKPVTTGANPASGGEMVTLFSESFGNNTSSARDWKDSYKDQGGISSVYSGSTYTITNAKQSKNTVGKTNSGLIQTTQNKDAIFEIKDLNVAAYSDLSVSYYWKASSIKGTYSTSLYYSKDGGTTYTEVEKTAGNGATTFVEVTYTLPADAVLSNLCLKVVFNTSNTSAVIDEFVLKGTN